ncbi:hypothetical protein VOLCADRAFT_80513 [Volvox carteri f. nagariensis]|uniref:MIR domain-containing protein n=1 Tax=Volvox carteri f. nagariensis TaxID=3068 RepID=D8TS03_VOLCA|nr:uncharacterized protein VOLCADRAFT_80513 [Volvox carteri f. nagariensis]EFJ49609.1 hypothetical protein VOLCADRAFT_80513 [Volvox carteri f. nagariensis]|eukprot:XP_002949116.1 hypothetical protein VOLCADRAFT_80513 [Volvox carteri f. nagariensis]
MDSGRQHAVVALAFLWLSVYAHAENLVVTCGSTLKLQHVLTKARLHSHQVAYSRGSQQQSVTGYPDGDDGNSLWLVQGLADEPCTPGAPMKKGTRMRLLHVATRKWLHSHLYQSPLSNSQEVSAFGSDTQSDGGDVWTLEWDGKGKIWKQNTKVRFKHVDTGVYLFSHDAKYGNPIAGQFEVAGIPQKNKNTEWMAAEGVYMPKSSEKGAGDDDKEEL